MRTRNLTKTGLLVALITNLLAQASSWGDAFVYVTEDGFSPSSVSINVGETVYFIVDDDFGPYCIQSTTGAWTPWYLWDYGDGFGITFNQRGDYGYRDTFTYNSGIIHVGTSVPNQPPLATITSPGEGIELKQPASFTFAADVSDSDNGIWAVEFYVGAELVDTVYSSPFSTQVTNLPAGNYLLSVTAYDNAMASTTKTLNITVQPGSPPMIPPGSPRIVAGQFQFEVAGLTVGKQAVLQGSATLGASANWVSLQTNAITSSTMSFSAAVVPGNQFFQVMETP